MNRLTSSSIILAVGIFTGITASMTHDVFAETQQIKASSLPLDDLRAFSEAFTRIKNDYVEQVEDKVLLENAIRGMLSGLDPHSSYLAPDEFKELQVETSGQFGGLGIEVTMENGFVKIISPIDDTPAQKAGVQSGDLIIRLNDSPVKGMTLGDAVKIMRGKPGTDILLTIVRDGEEQPLKIKITRSIIKVTSIKSRLIEKHFGYIRITRFQSKTGPNMKKAIAKFIKEQGDNFKGLVLDLRNNPGGVLSASVEVSDAFLTKGLIVYTEGRVADSKMKFKAKPIDVINGAPIVVLVNGGSASASEIVAGALQDHGRAIIMGKKTFGKGSVQTISRMKNKGGIKLTTARYFTPSGRSIQAEGIVPDIELSDVKVATIKAKNSQLKEADMLRHLKSKTETKEESKEKKEPSTTKQKTGSESKNQPKTKTLQTDTKKDEPLVSKDYALYEAVNLLKALSIYQKLKKTKK
ncbi:MAG: S41 family peptidase [Methylococcales bacterium]|jgi:carboxyl-terminal processing protease|nr:S41 family peptidase [Methylococcales bacterium]MBT7409746.1 S41 family peptidase [Methylococcales bacterium]